MPRVLRSASGSWTVAGWSATTFVQGSHLRGRWNEILSAGRALHRAIASQPRPAFLDSRTDRWAVADRAVWGEINFAIPAELGPEIGTLIDLLQPIEAVPQVVHSDLCGNTLIADGLPPAIMDFSALFRPVAYAEGIMISDAVIWEEAPTSLVQAWVTNETTRQMLIRACLFRIYVAAVGWLDMPDRLALIAGHHAPLTRWIATTQ
jgi:uncharacterized protein (TIGR02569 family)